MQFIIKCDCNRKDDCGYIERITEAIESLEEDYPSIVDFDDVIIVKSKKFLWNGHISENDYSCMLSCGVLEEASDEHLRWIMRRLYFDTELNARDEIEDDGDDEYSDDEEDEGGDDMNNLERALARLNESREIEYPIEVISDTQISACATGSGKIKISSGAVNRLSEEELAFIIAHEEAHLKKMHIQTEVELVRSVGKTATDIAKDKDYGIFKRVMGVVAVTALAVVTAPLVSKLSEIEADADAKKRMLDAGYSEKDVLRFFEQNASQQKGSYFSSHPTASTRLTMLK